MTSKTRDLYQNVLKAINEVTARKVGKEPSPEVVISDFEIAILGAVAFEFPSARARGCWFHFCQAIFRYGTNKLGLKNSYQYNPGVKKIIRMLSALALLDHTKALEGFQVFISHSNRRLRLKQ